MNSLIKFNWIVPVVALLLSDASSIARAQEPSVDFATRLNDANQLVRDGEIEKAMDSYRDISDRSNDENASRLDYNSAVAHYKNGDIESAASLFKEAAGSDDVSLAASSRFNLGNCAYATALANIEQDPELAMADLKSAISHYRDSLKLNRENADARANIELASKLLKQLLSKEEEQQNQDQQQNQNDQDQSNQESESDQQENQQNESGESNDDDSQSQQDQSEKSESDDDQSQSENQQDGSESEGDSQQKDDGSDQQDNPPQNAEEQSESKQSESSDGQESQEDQQPDQTDKQAGDQQKENEDRSQRQSNQQSEPNARRDQQEDGQSDNAESEKTDGQESEAKDVPTGELTSGNPDEKNDPSGASMAIANAKEQDGKMSKEEALKLLQSVRDRDMLRRLRQQQRERSRRRPVDKDW